MDDSVKGKVLKVLNEFGMSGAKAAEAMGVTYAVFRNKKNESPGHSFNKNNYLDLIKFLKRKMIKISGVSERM